MQATHMHTLPLPPSLSCPQHLDKLSRAEPHKQTQQDRMWSGLVEGGRKLSVRCGNVWLGPDTQITTEVVGPECKGVG